jgi:hypothetical protein
MKFAFIAREKATFPIDLLCSVHHRPPDRRAAPDAAGIVSLWTFHGQSAPRRTETPAFPGARTGYLRQRVALPPAAGRGPRLPACWLHGKIAG